LTVRLSIQKVPGATPRISTLLNGILESNPSHRHVAVAQEATQEPTIAPAASRNTNDAETTPNGAKVGQKYPPNLLLAAERRMTTSVPFPRREFGGLKGEPATSISKVPAAVVRRIIANPDIAGIMR